MKYMYLLVVIPLVSRGMTALELQSPPHNQKQNIIPLVPDSQLPDPASGKINPLEKNTGKIKAISSSQTAQDVSLSTIAKTKSDAVCAYLLQAIAQEVFTELPAKMQSKSNQKIPQLKTAYDAYLFYIKDMLRTLDLNPEFKRKNELKKLLEGGSLDTFFSKELSAALLKQEAFIQTFYDQITAGNSPIFAQFIGMMTPLFFISPLEPAVVDSLEDILINIVVSGRKKYNLTAASRTISDGLVVAALDRVFDMIAQEIDNRPKQGGAVSSGKLSQDYIRLVGRYISRLRSEPQFLKYEGLRGTAARTRSNAAGNPIQKLALYPLLDLLEATDISLLDRNKLKYAMNGQLIFSDQALNDIFNRTTVFEALLKDRISRIMEQRGNISVDQFLNEMVPLATTTAKLKEVITLLSKTVGIKPDITQLQAELNKIDVDTEKVVGLFKKLSGKNSIPFESHLRAIIEASIKEKETAVKGVEIIKAARAEYERTKKYVDAFVLQELQKKQRESAHPVKMDKPIALFTSLDRTPDTVQRIFSYNLGVAAATDTYAKKNDFRKWFHPYGLLLEVLRTAPISAQEVAAEGPHAQLLVLVDSLKALNTSLITNKKYAQAILDNKELVIAGIYKNTLARIIMFLESKRINEFILEITQFIKQVGIHLEEKQEFNARMMSLRSFLVDLFLKDIIETLAHLNDGTGDRPVDGLATELAGGLGLRNAVVYQQLKGAFKPLLDLINKAREDKSLQTLSYTDFAKARDLTLASITHVLEKPALQARFVKTKPVEEQRKEIMNAFERYCNRLWMRESSGVQQGALQSIQSAAVLLPTAVEKEPEIASAEPEYDGSIPPAPPAPPM